MTLATLTDKTDSRRLFVLGCSQTKLNGTGSMPAIARYDGPMFRVLRSFLRERPWPEPLSVAVLSAEHGLIGGLSGIEYYNQRLTSEKAQELRPEVTRELKRLLAQHQGADLFMGRDYLEAIDLDGLGERAKHVNFIEGGIGQKLHQLRQQLHALPIHEKPSISPLPDWDRPLYFLPDWDDFLDVDYDFEHDQLSSPSRKNRNEAHGIELMRPDRLCDGVLVSLAQNTGTKGLLRRVKAPTRDSLSPRSVRENFNLAADQWAFADCGAFSYSNEDRPTITVEQAVAVYDLYGFDLGASVDHIPLEKIRKNGKRQELSLEARRQRVELTRENAEKFLALARKRKARFTPVGIVQGLDAEDFARQIPDYADMGYRHIALGGLVPRSDADILEVVEQVEKQFKRLNHRPWLHLMGIFRPKLQQHFRRLGVDSFDSATYFRKAWLRSDQNYLGTDGQWYAAIRVPPSYDGRTAKRLLQSGKPEKKIQHLERVARDALRAFASRRVSLDACLEAVMKYDKLLDRGESTETRLRQAYRRTLQERPWEKCHCRLCKDLGIEMLVFRGLNRNKRRGAHNTWRLFLHITE